MDQEHNKHSVNIKYSSKNFSEILEKELNNILILWEKKVRLEVHSAKDLHTVELKNSMPIFLKHIAELLCSKARDFGEVSHLSKEHGRDRSTYPNYTINQIISEYKILREIIFRVLGEVPAAERDIILDAIEEGISEAASEFSEQQYQLREKFVSLLAHDLRTPLTVAQTSAQLILRGPENSASIQILASRIVKMIERIDSMIKDLLDASLTRKGQCLSLKIEKCDLRTIAHFAFEEARLILKNKFILKADSSIIGFWDPKVLQRAIGNLFSNASKYGLSGGPIQMTITQEGSMAKIAIHNEGSPIPEGEKNKIFENFYRSSDVKAGISQGWGIGLSLVKAAAVSHGGSVQVESEEKIGTTFTIIVPLDARSKKKDLIHGIKS
jgi:signal transduction histidine kinase